MQWEIYEYDWIERITDKYGNFRYIIVILTIKEVLQNPQSTLDDLYKTLAAYNLEIKPRGNGIVIGDKTQNLFVKASNVHRDLSKGKLTKRFGEFKTSKITTDPLKKFGKPKNSYWEKYKALSDLKKNTKIEDLKLEKLSRLTLQEALIRSIQKS